MKKLNDMQAVFNEITEDFVKFFEKGNMAAGTRLRKGLQEIKNMAQEIRKDVQETKNNMKTQKVK